MILFSANVLGIVCARSLHYQFLAWYAHQIPFLLWQGPFELPVRSVLVCPVVLGSRSLRSASERKAALTRCSDRRLAIGIGIEWAWNVYPSTERSSMTLTMSNLVLVVAAVTGGSPEAERFVQPPPIGAEAEPVTAEKKLQ